MQTAMADIIKQIRTKAFVIDVQVVACMRWRDRSSGAAFAHRDRSAASDFVADSLTETGVLDGVKRAEHQPCPATAAAAGIWLRIPK